MGIGQISYNIVNNKFKLSNFWYNIKTELEHDIFIYLYINMHCIIMIMQYHNLSIQSFAIAFGQFSHF